ncbi:putative bifunctional diguanylate cyclase/phosphodiesterase [Croceibacterium ferulae]|uniref:putative bifunctional diguanylate cyclase/phosphodiesterase n=1 Tax=Croceibacterium ferulae TaxID=1854641 RepID=UPI000EB45FC8|nr:EAL domain-containing protein [Croceibacterium ferulae]
MQIRANGNPVSERSRFLLQFVVPAFAAVLMVAAVLAGLIVVAAGKADQVATENQQNLLATVLQQRIDATAHDQEGVTVWDDALLQVRAPVPDLAWIDSNLGTWMASYHRLDEIFVLSASGEPIYGMQAGHVVGPAEFDSELRSIAMPLLAKVHAAMARPGTAAPKNTRMLTPGAIDLGVVGSRPAIVSAKPIVSDSGEVVQRAGTEPIHLAIRYLDGAFLQELAMSYALQDAHFRIDRPADVSGIVPLRDDGGQTFGYLSWEPFRPGTLLIKRVLPLSILSLVLVCGVLAVLLRHIRRSILAREASETQAQHLAFHDTLTGLPNRMMFDDRLAHELAAADAQGRSVALLYLDLDGFKGVNDTLGHPAGDELIQAVGARLQAVIRSTDLVARIGGDEFAIIQTGVRSPAEVEVLCLRLIEVIDEPFAVSGTQARVGVSIGIAIGPADAGNRAELARKADIALYESKAAGKGRFLFFAPAMDASIQGRKQIENDLRLAVDAGDQLEVYYQPLFSPESGAITGAEALLRWHHPEKGLISPALFVPIAEQTGQITQIGEWVLEQACRDAGDWPIGSVAVNVSAVQLRDPHFANRALSILKEASFPPERLEVELTETSLIENAAGCDVNLKILRAAGVRVALDDFGTGYSSFSHLQALSVDRLKIDRSFVSGIGSGNDGRAIISAIMDLARASGLKVTAEGVETAEQQRFLSGIGCNSLQGYLLARPMPAHEMRLALAQPAST